MNGTRCAATRFGAGSAGSGYRGGQRLASSRWPGPVWPGFFVPGASNRTTERLHRSVQFIEVDADQSSSAAIAGNSPIGDHLSDGAVGHADVVTGDFQRRISTARRRGSMSICWHRRNKPFWLCLGCLHLIPISRFGLPRTAGLVAILRSFRQKSRIGTCPRVSRPAKRGTTAYRLPPDPH